MAGEEGAAFSAGRKIFSQCSLCCWRQHCCCWEGKIAADFGRDGEDSTVAVTGSDQTLLLLLRSCCLEFGLCRRRAADGVVYRLSIGERVQWRWLHSLQACWFGTGLEEKKVKMGNSSPIYVLFLQTGEEEKKNVGEFRLPHARTGSVLIVAHWRPSTLTQYFTWFGKSPTSTGESILLETYRERITTHMEEEDHFTQTQLSLLSHCCTRQQGCCPWQPLTFSLVLSRSLLYSLSLSLLSHVCLYL